VENVKNRIYNIKNLYPNDKGSDIRKIPQPILADFTKENRFVTPVGPAMDGGDLPYLILRFLQKKNCNF
jgi:hypothetical protein